MRAPIIYLPVEIQSREFDSKALLAAVLAKRGYSVLFGEQWTIFDNLKRLPPGAILFKTGNRTQQQGMHVARQHGHASLLLEEELLAHTEEAAIVRFCSRELFELVDVMLANSAREKQVVSAIGGGAVRIETTGNPRIDFLKPAFHPFFKHQTDMILKKFGDYVLVNTNFGIANSVWGDVQEVFRLHTEAGFVNPDDPASATKWAQQAEFERLNKAAVSTAVKELCRRRPALNVVLRPHPAEAVNYWKEVFKDHPTVAIGRQGSHIPWTLSAKLLLHTSCTTGMEAAAAGKVALSLVTKDNWLSRSFISNRLNPVFAEPMALIDAAEAYLDKGELLVRPELDLIAAEEYVANIGDKSAADRIATLLTEALPPPRGRVDIPAVTPYERGAVQKGKLDVSLGDCGDILGRILGIIGNTGQLGLDQIADSLFYLAPPASA